MSRRAAPIAAIATVAVAFLLLGGMGVVEFGVVLLMLGLLAVPVVIPVVVLVVWARRRGDLR